MADADARVILLVQEVRDDRVWRLDPGEPLPRRDGQAPEEVITERIPVARWADESWPEAVHRVVQPLTAELFREPGGWPYSMSQTGPETWISAFEDIEDGRSRRTSIRFPEPDWNHGDMDLYRTVWYLVTGEPHKGHAA